MKVSVSLTTYNHEQYLVQAIESVLMQKTDFDFEVLIGEDCSTDGTKQICLDYKEKYPDKIRLNLREKNLGIAANFFTNIKACKGKYVALLEGDDYWTDEKKLQKQVDALEKNEENGIVICFHNVELKYEFVEGKDRLYNKSTRNKTYTIKDFIEKEWFAHTASIMFKKEFADSLPETYYSFQSGDIPLGIHLAQYGDIIYLPDVMSVYRKNQGGITIKRINNKNEITKCYINMMEVMDKEMNMKYHDSFEKMISKQYLNLLKWFTENQEKEKVNEYIEICKSRKVYYSSYEQKQLIYLFFANRFPFLIILWKTINKLRN